MTQSDIIDKLKEEIRQLKAQLAADTVTMEAHFCEQKPQIKCKTL